MGHEVVERLIISYAAASTSLLALKEAAAGLCAIIWLVDLSDRGMAASARMLRRFGTVVDVAGLSTTETVQALRRTHPTGVMAVTDPSMMLLSDIAADLDLPFHSPPVARRLSDKQVQRQALREAGVAVPPFWEIPEALDTSQARALASGVRFPAVLKPRRGDGSRRVRPVRDIHELTEFIVDGDAFSAEPGGWIVEGYLSGDSRAVSRFADIVSVESFVVDGSVHHLAVTGRLPFAEPFRETGSVLPSDISADDAVAAQALATDAILGLGVRHGCVHTELKFTPHGPSIVEVNGRVGGGIPELLELAGADVNLLRFAMERALGLPLTLDLPLRFSKVAYRRIVTPPVWAHRIAAMSGQEHVKDLPGVHEVTINRVPGDAVDSALGLGEFVCSVYGATDDHDQVEEMCDRIDRTVLVDYEEVGAGVRPGTVGTPPDGLSPVGERWERAGRPIGVRGQR
jgi:predicted ATP-grasp superfamily ATP-dependent carboligase